MSITKKPHYVPAAYLQFWSIDGKPSGRDSTIYVTDENGCNQRKCSKTAIEKWLYSKEAPNEAEEYFGELEGDWAKLISEFNEGTSPKAHLLASLLLLQSSYFLLRNRKFENKSTTKERIDIYKSAIEGYWREVLMDGELAKSLPECGKKMLDTWECHLLPNKNEPFITSDNPTLTLNFKENHPGIIFFPMLPNWALIAFKKDSVKLTKQQVTEQDVSYLNSYTAMNSNREVYSHVEMSPDEVNSFGKWLDQRPERVTWFDNEAMHLESFNYPVKGMTFSFLE